MRTETCAARRAGNYLQRGICLRVTNGRSYGGVYGACKFQPKTGSTRLIPSLRLKSRNPGLRPKQDAHW